MNPTPEQIKTFNEIFTKLQEEGHPCIFCGHHTDDAVGVATFEGEIAESLGAALGKIRVFAFTACNLCLHEFKSEDAMHVAVYERLTEQFKGTRQ